MRIRYLVLPIVAVLLVSFGLVLASWTTPYVLTGSYADGTRGWEMHERRTITGAFDSFRAVRYYPTGELLFVTESPGLGGSGTYWHKDGTQYASRAAWVADHPDLLLECDQDGERPSFPVLDWISSLFR